MALESGKAKKGARVFPLEHLFILFWSGRRDSNSRPQPWQGCALPAELLPHSTCLVFLALEPVITISIDIKKPPHRSTLPGNRSPSTIDAALFHDRVRDGVGWVQRAMSTGVSKFVSIQCSSRALTGLSTMLGCLERSYLDSLKGEGSRTRGHSLVCPVYAGSTV